jgi:hypothetical protein
MGGGLLLFNGNSFVFGEVFDEGKNEYKIDGWNHHRRGKKRRYQNSPEET